jgi:CCR4-NOT transcription complex subunit 1
MNAAHLQTAQATPQANQPGTAGYVPPVSTPKYKLSDIKLQSLQNNSNLIYINSEIPLLNAQPTLKNFIIPALDKAVNDMMSILLEKAVKISVNTAEPIIKKDFSLDPEESHMRVAARNMVANMSSGMMLITGKEPLTTHLFNTLKAQFTQPLSPELANTYKDLINQACGHIVQDNIELCMCFLQKNAIQRSIIELERKLQVEFESRQNSRAQGRVHYDPSILTYHQEKMPESIRQRVGPISPQQFSVYEEFGKNLPGFKTNVEERMSQPNFNQVAEEMGVHYENLMNLLRNEIALMPTVGAMQQLTLNVQNLIMAVHDFKMTQTPASAYTLVKKLIMNLLEGYTWVQNEMVNSAQLQQPVVCSLTDPVFIKYRDCNLSVMKVILGDQRFCVNNWILREVQKIWLECPMECRYSVDGLAILFKYKLLSSQIVDTTLAQFVETGNMKAIQIAMQFLRFFYIDNASAYLDVQLVTLLESISRVSTISRFVQQNADLRDLIEIIRMNYDNLEDASGAVPISTAGSNNRIYATALSMMYTGVQQARDFDDPPSLKEKSEQLLHEWIQHHFILPQKENQKAFQQFVLQMNSQGLFKTGLFDSFFSSLHFLS